MTNTEYKDQFNTIIDIIKKYQEDNIKDDKIQKWINDNFSEILANENVRIKNEIVNFLKNDKICGGRYNSKRREQWIHWLETQTCVLSNEEKTAINVAISYLSNMNSTNCCIGYNMNFGDAITYLNNIKNKLF